MPEYLVHIDATVSFVKSIEADSQGDAIEAGKAMTCSDIALTLARRVRKWPRVQDGADELDVIDYSVWTG